MRVLLLGSGAKDHAVAWWFSKSCYLSELYVAQGNLATGRFAINLSDVNPSDPQSVYEACRKHKIDYVFIGTEAPLFTGVVKFLNERGIKTFGAPEGSIKLEGDRAFSRAFATRHNIQIPRSSLFADMEGLEKYLALLNYARLLFKKGPVLLEAFVKGTPASCSILVDRNGYALLPVTSDYTNKASDDTTPTGGMGAICPVPIIEEIKDKIIERIINPTLYGMQVEDLAYKGILTLSLMITPEREPYLVDYHVRFNDPAAQAMIPIIKTDLIEILNAMENDRVGSLKIETTDECTVAVVLASPGYPMYPVTGMEVEGLTNAFLEPIDEGPIVFCGAIQNIDGVPTTTGGRNITVVGKAQNLAEANRQAYETIKRKAFPNLWYRDDIGNAYFSS